MSSYDETELLHEENGENCKHLNVIRPNFTECWEYPQLVLWSWDADECDATCIAEGHVTENGLAEHCCALTCSYYKMGIISSSRNSQGDLEPIVFHWQGFVSSFMLSVGNDSKWESVIHDSVQRCYFQYEFNTHGLYCNLIPLNLWEIFECSYRQNFLDCPVWNPKDLPECEFAKEYVSKCTRGGYSVQYE